MNAAVQAIIFGDALSTELGECLKLVRGAGFAAMEAGPLLIEHSSVEVVRRLMKECGVALSAWHAGYRYVLDVDSIEHTCDIVRQLGGEHIVCSGIVSGGFLPDSVARTSDLYRACLPTIESYGLRLSYHHFNWDLRSGAGGNTLDRLMALFPTQVGLVIDTYWAAEARVKVSDLVGAYGERCWIAHLKDGDPAAKTFSSLGQGSVPLAADWPHLASCPLSFATYEQDDVHGGTTITKAISKSAAFLARLMKGEETTE